MSGEPVCIYHANCADGTAAAWVVKKYFRDEVELRPYNYGMKAPEDISRRNIFIVDFSFPKDQLLALGKANNVVVVLDHHKSAVEELGEFAVPPTIDHYELIHRGSQIIGYDRFPEPVYAIFDMKRSGVGITWDYFFPGQPLPKLLRHIQDRDLWKFVLPDTREIYAGLTSYSVGNFGTFDALVTQMSNPIGALELINEGSAIQRRHMQMVEDVIAAGARKMTIGGYSVPVCNAPFGLSSDMGNILCKGQPFAATYYDLSNGNRQFSLRSTDEGVDVSAVAKAYNGGGHRNAAGFTAPAGWEGDP